MGSVIGILSLASGCQDDAITSLSCRYHIHVNSLSAKVLLINHHAFYINEAMQTMVPSDCKDGATLYPRDSEPIPDALFGFPFNQTCNGVKPNDFCNWAYALSMPYRAYQNQMGQLKSNTAILLSERFYVSDLAKDCQDAYENQKKNHIMSYGSYGYKDGDSLLLQGTCQQNAKYAGEAATARDVALLVLPSFCLPHGWQCASWIKNEQAWGFNLLP